MGGRRSGACESDYCNVRPVKWLKTVSRILFSADALHSFGSFSSVSTSDEFLEEVIEVLAKAKDVGLPTVTGTVLPSKTGHGAAGEMVGTGATESAGISLRIAPSEVPDLAERAIEETKDFLLRQWSRTGADFEQVVAAVFRAMGYTATVQRALTTWALMSSPIRIHWASNRRCSRFSAKAEREPWVAPR